jgi:hypothetical protein
MALQYDFDMGPMKPQGLPDAFGDLDKTGIAGEHLAMFRDPQTVVALKSADPAVQNLFIDSGFALQASDGGAPPGRFAQRDEAARLEVIARLSRNLPKHPLDGANWGGFDFPAFMKALGTAKILEDDALMAPSISRQRGDPKLIAARDASRQMRGRRMLAFGGLMIGLVLLLFVASQMLV